MALGHLAALAILQTVTARADAPVVLENESLRVEFSARDGAVTRLLNKPTQVDLIWV
jgi:hypothetical protein